ncbi:MAG: hypothetical protein WC916_00955 [Candidatus Woesearchaeota archaeon]
MDSDKPKRYDMYAVCLRYQIDILPVLCDIAVKHPDINPRSMNKKQFESINITQYITDSLCRRFYRADELSELISQDNHELANVSSLDGPVMCERHKGHMKEFNLLKTIIERELRNRYAKTKPTKLI